VNNTANAADAVQHFIQGRLHAAVFSAHSIASFM
jgi:hypothetical protein